MLQIDLDEFASAANWDRLPPEIAGLKIETSALSQRFPGAILPAVAADGRVFWYAVATTQEQWRHLRPLLVAFVGPTVTKFSGQTGRLRPGVRPEVVLAQAGVQVVGVLMPSPETVELAAKALARLVALLESRPNEVLPPPLSTAAMLARFDVALATGDKARAEVWLQKLRSEWRLDELNLRFAEVRLLWSFRLWPALVEAEWLHSLVYVRKPPSVSKMLLEAFWEHYFGGHSGDRHRELYWSGLRHFIAPLLGEVGAVTDSFVIAFRHLEGVSAPTPVPPPPAVERQEVPPITVLAAFREWLGSLPIPEYDTSQGDAREFLNQFAIEGLEDPAVASEIAAALLGVPEGRARERLNVALPLIFQWVTSEQAYPRRSLFALYEALFTLFVLLDSQDKYEREAIAILIDGLLAVGLSKVRYQNLLSDIQALFNLGLGKESAYWAFDVAELLLQHSAQDNDSRRGALDRILSALQTVAPVLRGGQRAAYNSIATAVEWPILPPQEVGSAPEEKNIWGTFAGKTIALYSLTEAAARQASVAIRALAPTAKVELISDHVCTTRLQSLAKNADLFVLAACSAKHAATDCIMKYRGSRSLAYTSGKGFSSFIRAIEDFAMRGA